MKKIGFTIMEVLVALAVVGIVAAIVVPQITSVLPDENKLKVLKIQKMLTEINAELLNDKAIYYEVEDGANGLLIGLASIRTPRISPYNNEFFTGNRKYINLLADKLDYDINRNSTLEGNFEDNFYTKDGIYWEIPNYTVQLIPGNPHTIMTYTLLVDFSGDGVGVDCSYEPVLCPNPDRFEFTIDTYGKVTGRDPLTRAYIENPDRLNEKTADFVRAKEIYAESLMQ